MLFIYVETLLLNSKYPVDLPSYSFNVWEWDSSVDVSGTWKIENDDDAHPLQTTKISCEKREKICRSHTALLSTLSSGLFSRPFLYILNDTYDIIKWDDTEIIFVDDSPSCVSYVHSINRLTKQVTGLRTKKVPAQDDLCKTIFEKEIKIKLVDGFINLMEERQKEGVSLIVLSSLPTVFFLALLYLIWRKPRQH